MEAVLPVEVDRRGSVGWGVECQARLGEGGWRGGRGVRCIVVVGGCVCVGVREVRSFGLCGGVERCEVCGLRVTDSGWRG